MRGGSLIRPDIIPIDIFLSELTFYRLSYSAIKDFLDIEGLLLEENEIIRPIRTKRELIWATFDRPETSSVARIVSLISITGKLTKKALFPFFLEKLPIWTSNYLINGRLLHRNFPRHWYRAPPLSRRVTRPLWIVDGLWSRKFIFHRINLRWLVYFRIYYSFPELPK